ncbi:transferase [Gigaspora rosea]|uniref:Transferase n=1 Tax=Gigaspora rosea TaxID=44941 RepID=A0A397UAZ8_9GLOM|nr:transferase [Gigaspora rosea]
MPATYTGCIYFFKNDFKKNNFMNVQKLLESLGDVLNDYYPLAGTLKGAPDGRSVIDCNDQDVQFIIAECSDITINQLEENNWKHAAISNGLMPPKLIPNKIVPILFLVQHTTFADGSVALGFAIHKHVMDGVGLFTFIKNWGLRARLEQIDPPIHDRSLLKASGNPPTDIPSKYFRINSAQDISIRNPVSATTKIFHFSYDVLNRLRDYYSVGISNGNWISTNDALVAHFWRTSTRARNLDLNTEVACGFALNGRDVLNPLIPKSYYGNVVFGVRLRMLVSQLINGPPSSIALQVRKALTDTNESHIRSIIDWVEQQPDKSLIQFNAEYDGKYFGGSSWAKFQKHDLIDFGDGTPIKLRLLGKSAPPDGLYLIIGTEDGVDVCLSLQTEIFVNFE